jgi:hypothetical protein
VGKYPGWDKPHPGEWWEKFRCGGKVYEGYRSDCPDFQPRSFDERWKTPFSDVGKQIVENIHDNVERIRTAPSCLSLCRGVALLPGLLSTACLAGRNVATRVPNVYALAFAVLCEVFKTRLAASAGYLTGALGLEWCKESFCKPPSGTGK